MMNVYVDIRDIMQCTRPAEVIHTIETALCAAGLQKDADKYAQEMKAMRPQNPETALLNAPDCIVFWREEVELEERVLAAEGV